MSLSIGFNPYARVNFTAKPEENGSAQKDEKSDFGNHSVPDLITAEEDILDAYRNQPNTDPMVDD